MESNLFSKFMKLMRSVWFCFRYLPLRTAMHLPVIVESAVDVQALRRGQLEICNPKRFSILLGGGGSPGLYSFKSVIRVSENAKLILRGRAIFGRGTVLRVDEGCVLDIGGGFYCNNNNYFRCADNVTIGEGCYFGWENIVNTTDGHHFLHNGAEGCMHGEVKIGNRVWVTTRCIVGKSVVIPDGCVLAQGSIVQKSFDGSNLLIGGVPAKVIKTNVSWMP